MKKSILKIGLKPQNTEGSSFLENLKKNPPFALCVAFVLLSFGSCSKAFLGDEPVSNPESNFEYFYQQINDNYAGKDVRPVSWDSLYKIYRPKITAQTTDNQLIDVFKAMVAPYKDSHLNFKTPTNFYNVNSERVTANGIPDYVNSQALETSLKKRLKGYKNIFGYEKTAENIGYIAINKFDGYAVPQTDYEFFDNILEELKDTKSLIIDVRTNSGGNENYAQLIAGRFATVAVLYKYTRVKTGLGKTDYSDFSGYTLKPRGAWQYTKPVIVLTGGFTYSTANNFTLMMRVLPNVQTLGNLTGDGVFGSIRREMPNGWFVEFSSGLAFLPDKTVIEGSGGLVPKTIVTISAADKTNGRDAILEKALELLK
jgi:carboxyl-terminal processing protease